MQALSINGKIIYCCRY